MTIDLSSAPTSAMPAVTLAGQGVNIPSPQTASNTAAKASFGVGGIMGIPYDDFVSSIANGQEPQIRQQAAAKADADIAKRKQNLVNQAVTSGANSQLISEIIGQPKVTDPKSVFEEYHASKYFQPMWDSTREDLYKNIQDSNDAINAGVNNLTYKNYAIQRLQKSMDNFNNQGQGITFTQGHVQYNPEAMQTQLSQSFGTIKNLLSQFYSEWTLRGGTGDLTKLLGSDLEEERQKAYSMPFDQYKQWLDGRMDQLDKENPQLALAFGSAIVGQSNYDIGNNDATTIMGIGATAAGGLMAANRIRGAVQSALKASNATEASVSEALRRASNPGDTAVVNGRTVKNVTPQDVKQTQAAAHGDLGEAAIQSTTQDILAKVQGKENVAQSEIKSLPALFKSDAFGPTEPGGTSLGTDIYNRIKEQYLQRGVDFAKGMQTLLRVNRTPAIVVSEDLARAVRTWIKNKYSGMNSYVGDTSGTLQVLDVPSNTYHYNLDILNPNGEYFENEAEAVSLAETAGIGLHEPETSTRQYWDDEATAAAFEVDHLKKEIAKYDARYSKEKFKPARYYRLQNRLKEQNLRKRNAWSQRAGAYWRPDMPVSEKLGKVTLEQQGLGWFIRGWIPLDETEPFVRSGLLKTPNAWSGPSRIAKRQGTQLPYLQDFVSGTYSQRLSAIVKIYSDAALGFDKLRGIRTPEETLSPEENIQRKVASFGPGKLADALFSEDARILQSVPSKYVPDLKRLLTANQNMPNPTNPEEHGYFFKTLGELENWYQNYATPFPGSNSITGRLPTEEEVAGYFAYTRMYETERGLRTLALLRNKWRAGVESWRVKIGKTWTNQFDAVKRTVLPSALEKSPVYINLNGQESVKISGQYTKELREMFDKGEVQVMELWNREDMPFHELSKVLTTRTKPRYVITNLAENRPIDPNDQVPKRGGGHWMFPYNHYVRQASTYLDPVTKEWIYEGDKTVMPFQDLKLGNDFAMKFTEVQNLIREGLVDEARHFVQSMGIAGLNFDDHIWPMFKPYKGKPARFNLHEPFKLVPTDKTVMSINNDLVKRYEDKGGLLDTTRYGNMARNNQVEFTGERDAWDLHTIEDAGTARNPIYSYRPAQFVDPLDVINRGITRISNSMWLDDIKFFSAEHWYQTFEPWLDISKGGSPFYHFAVKEPQFLSGTPDTIKQLALTQRKKAMEFVRMMSPAATFAQSTMSMAASAIYEKVGSTAYHMFKPLEDLANETNPVQAMRSITADLKIGLFSVPAFWMQATAFTNIMALEPKYAMQATAATMGHLWSQFIPQHIDHIDQQMSNFGAFKPGHFKALNEALGTKSNFGHVGNEHAMMNLALSDRYMKNTGDVARYWGSTFFREGAQFVRRSAWFTAGLKWIDEHDGQLPQTRDDWAKVMDHASFLDHNMVRASNSSLNTGIMAVPTQFYTYPLNVTQMFLGKRITPIQRLRWFTLSTMLWGLGSGVSLAVGLPSGFLLEKEAKEHGYSPGINKYLDALMQGGLSALTSAATGGPLLDYSRFGIQGWGLLTGLFTDDPRWWNLLGAMPSSLINTLLNAYPLWQDFVGATHGINTSTPTNVPGVGAVPGGGGDWSKFNPTAEDFADLLKEWGAFSDAHRLWLSLRYGTQYSQRNTPLRSNVTTGQAITQALTGLQDVTVPGIGTDWSILSDRKAQQSFLVAQGSRNYNLALMALKVGNNALYATYMRKLSIIVNMGANPKVQADIRHEIFSRNKPLVDALQEQLRDTGGPEDIQRFQRQMQENK